VVAAVDPRVKCVASVVGIGNGRRWMRSVRRPDEYHDLLKCSAADRVRRVTQGFGHYEVYAGEPFRRVMEPTVAWFHQYLSARLCANS
jgi:hypothetical protein